MVVKHKPARPRILFSAKDHPDLPSGYGIIARHLVPRLADRYGKKNVIVYAPVYGRDRVEQWHGITVLPGVDFNFGEDLVLEHYQRNNCNLFIQVGDFFVLKRIPEFASRDQILWVQWAPFDFLNFPPFMKELIRYAVKVVPFTEYAERRFRAEGLENIHRTIYPGLDLNVWHPYDRDVLPSVMSSLGFTKDTWNIVICQANQRRKYLRETFEGIRLFMESYPESHPRVYLHTQLRRGGEQELDVMLAESQIESITTCVDQYVASVGGITEAQMAKIFAVADCVMDCCLEGYGYSHVQSQAVGVPCVTLVEGPGMELVKYGVSVPVHHSDFAELLIKPVPHPLSIAQALETLYKDGRGHGAAGVRWVQENLSWDHIADQWCDLIDEVMLMREQYSMYIPEPGAALRRQAKKVIELQ